MMDEKSNNFALFLERHSFEELLDQFAKIPGEERALFSYLFLGDEIWMAISNHKLALIESLTSAVKCNLNEDYGIVVLFLLRNHWKEGKTKINTLLRQHIDKNFYLKDNYDVNKKVVTWQQICARAGEIITGFINYCALSVEPDVMQIMDQLELIKETDPKKLEVIQSKTGPLMARMYELIDIPPAAESAAELTKELKEFYLEMGRIQLDIDHLDEMPNFDVPYDYISALYIISKFRLEMLQKGIPFDDIHYIQKTLRSRFLKYKFLNKFSFEEVALLDRTKQL